MEYSCVTMVTLQAQACTRYTWIVSTLLLIVNSVILIQLACSKCGFFYHPCVTLQGFLLSLAVDSDDLQISLYRIFKSMQHQ